MRKGYLGLGIEEVIVITSACDLTARECAAEDALAVLCRVGLAQRASPSVGPMAVGYRDER
jgi:hypothetical protein